MAKKRIYPSVVSMRMTEDEKEKFEKLVCVFKTNKSEFLRDWLNRLLETI